MIDGEKKRRYWKNILVEAIGSSGQEKLLQSSVLIVGTGGLGSPAAYYLAAAGVGTLGIIDGDQVEESNLQRQIIHNEKDLGKPKVMSACEKLHRLNSGIKINTYPQFLDRKNYQDIISNYQVVVDGTDNFETRFLINRACVQAGVAYIYGGVAGFAGQAMTIVPGMSPCLACVFPRVPDPDPESGVLGTVPGGLGSILATEAIKYLLGAGELLTGRMLVWDALSMQFFTVETSRNPECNVCKNN